MLSKLPDTAPADDSVAPALAFGAALAMGMGLSGSLPS